MTIRRSLALAFAFGVTALAGAYGSVAAADPQDVPCKVFAPGSSCVKPILEGTVDGQWLALIYRYDGTQAGAKSADVVSIGVGDGPKTRMLAAIRAIGPRGDSLNAEIRRGKLIVANAEYEPGANGCCPSQFDIRRFGFRNGVLHVERRVRLVNGDITPAQIDAALDRAPAQ